MEQQSTTVNSIACRQSGCNAVFMSRTARDYHVRATHQASCRVTYLKTNDSVVRLREDDGHFHCLYCDNGFKTAQSLRVHAKNCRPSRVLEEPEYSESSESSEDSESITSDNEAIGMFFDSRFNVNIY